MQQESNMVVNKNSFEENFLLCSVCHEKFDHAERSPKLLPCNHSFCVQCLVGIYNHANPPVEGQADDEVHKMSCPTCRAEVSLKRSQVQELPRDHRAVQLIDFMAQVYNNPKNGCLNHYSQYLSFFCKTCAVPICRDCTIVSHNKADGHEIVDINKALIENSSTVNDIDKITNESLTKMQARSAALSNALQRLDLVKDEKQRAIDEKFKEYQDMLDQRKSTLSSTLNEMVETQKTKIKSQQDSVEEDIETLKKLYENFKSSTKTDDVSELFRMTKQMKSTEAKFVQVGAANDTSLLLSCEFEVIKEGDFFTKIKEIGQIQSKADPTLNEPIKIEDEKTEDDDNASAGDDTANADGDTANTGGDTATAGGDNAAAGDASKDVKADDATAQSAPPATT